MSWPMDALYVLGNGSKWKDNEIRYSIRSLEKHCKDLGNIFIVGNCPAFLKDVIYLECPDPYQEKERNTLYKTLAACGDERLSDQFMKCDDDFFFMKDFSIKHFPVYSKGVLSDVIKILNEFKRYRNVLVNTENELKRLSLPLIDYEVHNPVVYHKETFKTIFEYFDSEIPVCMKSCYFNFVKETKPIPGIDMKINISLSKDAIKKELIGKPFFSVGDHGLTPVMKSYLERLFPDASHWESI